MQEAGKDYSNPAFLLPFDQHKGRNAMYDENNDYSVPLPDETLSEIIEGAAERLEGVYYEAR